MIPALVEGVSQAALPCSWSLLLPAFALGLGSRRARVHLFFAASLVSASWLAAAGWLVAPIWLAGVFLSAGAVWWWFRGANVVPAALIGVGSAWAWRPCVGPELGQALTTAQTDPVAAFGGLALFLVGVVAVGIALGIAASVGIEKLGGTRPARVAALVVGLLGLTMVLGLYPSMASTLARWSTDLWG